MIKQTQYYTATCDNCGAHIKLEEGDIYLFEDLFTARQALNDCEWIQADDEPESNLPAGAIYCPDCYRVNDDDQYEPTNCPGGE